MDATTRAVAAATTGVVLLASAGVVGCDTGLGGRPGGGMLDPGIYRAAVGT